MKFINNSNAKKENLNFKFRNWELGIGNWELGIFHNLVGFKIKALN
jgi:hypothetical protein